jgi:hypothetical protein
MKIPTSARSFRWASLFSSRTGFALALVAACQGEYPQNSLDPKTGFAETIHSEQVAIRRGPARWRRLRL